MPLIQDSDGDYYYTPDESDTPQSGTEGLPTDQDSSNLTDYLSSITKPNPLPSHETYVPTIGQKVASAIAGGGLTGGESLLGDIAGGIKSGLTLPADVMAGKVATPVTPDTGPQSSDVESQDDLLKRVQDMAALMGTGGLVEAPEAASLGSSMIRKSADVPAANAPVFYSAVENAVNNASMKAAPAQQWLSTIQNAKGVKPEELEWTGLKDYLGEKDGPITKSEVQGYLQANKTQLTDVDKGEKPNIPNNLADVDWFRPIVKNIETEADVQSARKVNPNFRETFKDQSNKQVLDKVNEYKQIPYFEGDPTKYEKYQLHGGENYREKLLTLPRMSDEQFRKNYTAKTGVDLSEFENIDNLRRNAAASEVGGDYKSSHWEEPNILAHVRMNDRTMNEPGFSVQNVKSGNKSQVFGSQAEAEDYQSKLPKSVQTKIVPDTLPKKTLHLEEVQSDWHQKGREKGYKLSDKQKADLEQIDQKLMNGLEEKDIGNPDINQVLQTATDKKVITPQEASKYKEYSKGENSDIPDAPFKKTWLDLALKRMIREAAEKGYDRLSWTPGEAQAARYDLSKEIKSIDHYKNKDENTYTVAANTHNNAGVNIPNSHHMTEQDLENTFGKEIAKKIINNEGNSYRGRPFKSLEGLDLKVGGEGMHYFYDKMLPATLKKITGQETKDIALKTNPKGWHITSPERTVSGKWMVKNNDPLSKGYHFDSKEEAEANLKQNIEGERSANQPIKYIDLPQSVKDIALQKGFPLFSSGIMLNPVENIKGLTPVSHNPFSKGDTNNDQINNTGDVPFLAGASNTPSGLPVNFDRRMPRYDDKLKLPNGQPADLYKYLSTHELTEYPLMKQGMKYEDAHKIATAAERKAVEADGLNWSEYEHVMDGYLKEIEHEKPKSPPKNLYLKPYPHDKQKLLKANEK